MWYQLHPDDFLRESTAKVSVAGQRQNTCRLSVNTGEFILGAGHFRCIPSALIRWRPLESNAQATELTHTKRIQVCVGLLS